MRIPPPEAIKEHFSTFLRRYNFAITLESYGAQWVDNESRKRMHSNHILCIMKNDLISAFPDMPTRLKNDLCIKTRLNIETQMLEKIKAGQGSEVAVYDDYL